MNYFNSIKVRLEHNPILPLETRKQFQFHKGTIRTQPLAHLSHAMLLFQFHKGTIRTVSAPATHGSCPRISIP